MSAKSTTSIYLGADGKLSVKEIGEIYKPVGAQCLVQVKYSGVNVADLKFFYVGMHSYITGLEFSGIVLEAGPDSAFKPGDTVFGMNPPGHQRPNHLGCHQDLAIAEAQGFFKIPTGLGLKEASVVTIATMTAIDALFNCLGFSFPPGNVSGEDPTNTPILIWGGASSVGLAAIQVAKAVGFSPIFATASAKNHNALLSMGATQCFDYKNPAVVDEIRSAAFTKGVKISVVFDTVVAKAFETSPEAIANSSPVLARSCCDQDTPAERLKLVASIPVPTDPSFVACLSYRAPGDKDFSGNNQDPEWRMRMRKIMEYFAENSDRFIKMPNIIVTKGAEAGIRDIERVANGNVSFEKITLLHPF